MSDNMKKMHKRQEMDGCISSEYVVGGAEVSCKYGSKTCVLNLTRSHGADTLDGRPLIIKSDCTSKNISGFGVCNKNRNKPCKCEPRLNEWSVDEKSNLCIIDPNTAKGSRAITVDSITVCEKGGIVSFKTSGQATPSYDNAKVKGAVEIVEDEKGSWRRPRDKKDFVGHVKVKNSGLYNFGIELHHGKTTFTAGSIFVYEYSWGKLSYVDEYDIKRHVGNEEQKFPEDMLKINEDSYESIPNAYYWKYWVDIILYADRDYYFEIDCFEENAIDYKLIGNQEKRELNSTYTAGVWILDAQLKKSDPDTYGYLKLLNYLYKNGKGNETIIMYLAPEYNRYIRDFISVRIAQGKSIASDGSNFLSTVALVFTGATYIKALSDAVKAVLGNVSTALSGIALIIAFLPKSVLERIKDKMYQNPNECLKVTLYDVSDGASIEGDYNITGCKVEICSEYVKNKSMAIYGEKYLPGRFHMLETQGLNIEKMNLIDSSIEKIFDEIDDTFK